jgi:hypothetical protein
MENLSQFADRQPWRTRFSFDMALVRLSNSRFYRPKIPGGDVQ